MIAASTSSTTQAGPIPTECQAKYTLWPSPRMAICGRGLQPDYFVSMEFDFNPTSRNPGRPFRNAVWFLYSPYQMEAYGALLVWKGQLIKDGTVTDYGKEEGFLLVL